jgi:hypothetical protein
MQEVPCNKLGAASTSAPQEISVTHSLWTRRGRAVYGRIVVAGVGDAVTIGDTIGDGVITGCAARLGGVGEGDIETIGDIVGMGCAEAATIAPPATAIPARTTPTNHRFMELPPPYLV